MCSDRKVEARTNRPPARPKGEDRRNVADARMTYDRSAVMRAVKSSDTTPERAVRAILRPIAPGYRLHRADLPGKPDIAYGRLKLAIFVHGCFWHGHDCARGARTPKTNANYWRAKIARNRARDERTLAALAAIGWRALAVYECELRDPASVRGRLEDALTAAFPGSTGGPAPRPNGKTPPSKTLTQVP